MKKSSVAAALLGLSSSAYAQSVSASQNGITYSFSVPDTTASSGSGDVYIQISGPTSFSYIALGSGSQMSGSNMFVIYTNSAGNNVTLSPRKATGHSQPQFDSSAQAVLTEGSGVSNNVMTANIRCSSCADKFDITSSSASLIYAALSGSPLNDDSTSATISQHTNTYGTMTMDMTQAKNSANDNPFVSSNGTTATPTTGTSGTQSCVPISQVSGESNSDSGATPTGFGFFGGSRPTGRPPWATGTGYPFKRADSTSSSACPSGYVLSGSSSGASFNNNGFNASQQKNMLMAHGIMAGLAFAVFFPFGAISIRLLSFPGLVWFHAAFQVFAYVFYIIAFGLGIWLANQLHLMGEAHPILGIVLFILLFFMPVLGQLHHRNFKKFQTRTIPSFAHIWLGRIVITLGIINGGLGLKLANNSTYGPKVYGVVAGIIFAIYLASIVIGERRRARTLRNPPKYDEVLLQDHRNMSPPTSPPRHREYYGHSAK
ncbi:uncharacterized protein PV09_07402 [Verruconis gallopava]|uniref:Cytochrome b561 domain-containing protein n=1 Tax=Verruconis gallopava TaxID=253628 RepID=A0A0D2APM3_9PEZI|nr:uncharacterized protein PV09_07402 [Verruconis gallopava]KIW01114.1 hypothetical protein PV09_07402 [Verruconis gallopava]